MAIKIKGFTPQYNDRLELLKGDARYSIAADQIKKDENILKKLFHLFKEKVLSYFYEKVTFDDTTYLINKNSLCRRVLEISRKDYNHAIEAKKIDMIVRRMTQLVKREIGSEDPLPPLYNDRSPLTEIAHHEINIAQFINDPSELRRYIQLMMLNKSTNVPAIICPAAARLLEMNHGLTANEVLELVKTCGRYVKSLNLLNIDRTNQNLFVIDKQTLVEIIRYCPNIQDIQMDDLHIFDELINDQSLHGGSDEVTSTMNLQVLYDQNMDRYLVAPVCKSSVFEEYNHIAGRPPYSSAYMQYNAKYHSIIMNYLNRKSAEVKNLVCGRWDGNKLGLSPTVSLTDYFKNENFYAVIEQCIHLKKFCAVVSNQDIVRLPANLTQLEIYTLWGESISLSLLRRFQDLKSLHIVGNLDTNTTPQDFANLTRELKHFSYYHRNQNVGLEITGEHISQLPQEVETLGLERIRYGGIDVGDLPRSLKKLKMQDVFFPYDQYLRGNNWPNGLVDMSVVLDSLASCPPLPSTLEKLEFRVVEWTAALGYEYENELQGTITLPMNIKEVLCSFRLWKDIDISHVFSNRSDWVVIKVHCDDYNAMKKRFRQEFEKWCKKNNVQPNYERPINIM